MPTYTYRCAACGDQFDVRQSFSDAPLAVCDKCGGSLKKIINSVGIVFKGSGFYHNDSKSKANSGLQAHSSDSTTQAESSGSSSAESPKKSTAESSSTPAHTSPAPAAVPGRTH